MPQNITATEILELRRQYAHKENLALSRVLEPLVTHFLTIIERSNIMRITKKGPNSFVANAGGNLFGHGPTAEEAVTSLEALIADAEQNGRLEYQDTLSRIIRDEVLVNASQMVHELNTGLPINEELDERVRECSIADDLSEPPEGYEIFDTGEDGWEWRYPLPPLSQYGFSTREEAIWDAYDNTGEEPPIIEALQHFIVTDWLADKIEAAGGLVTKDLLGFCVWGRTECGQGLEEDATLRAVARALVSEE